MITIGQNKSIFRNIRFYLHFKKTVPELRKILITYMNAGRGGRERLLHQIFDITKMKFPLRSAACRTTASKRFGFIIGNFIIETTAKISNERIHMCNRRESTSHLKQLPLVLVYCSHSTYQVLPFFIISHAWKLVLFINMYICNTVLLTLL